MFEAKLTILAVQILDTSTTFASSRFSCRSPPALSVHGFGARDVASEQIGFVSLPLGNHCGVFFNGLRSLTPGPPPFSSMNSTPADSNARRIAARRAFELIKQISLRPQKAH
jgi:hypothetical protein